MLRKLTVVLALFAVVSALDQFHEIFQWKTIDIIWPSEEIRTKVYDGNEFIPVNNAIAGIKIWKNKMYLTIPRWKEGVPVTLAVTSAEPINRNFAPRLAPFPNYQMQTVGDCNAFQFVQSMEIDPKGRMWILDTGRTATMSTEPKAHCPPRLVILDLEKDREKEGEKGATLRIHTFPSDVTPADSSYLNDIVLDHTDGGYAYITDNGKDNPGIIVYSLKENKSWKFTHNSMNAQAEAISFKVGNERIRSPVNVDGIALDPVDAPDRKLYYSPLSSFHLYSIPTSVLKKQDPNAGGYVKELGRKNSQTDGMMMSASGILYFGLLADDAVAIWDTKNQPSFTIGLRIIARDHDRMRWQDTFAFDERGSLWCVTNQLQNFISNKVDPNNATYRILVIPTGYKSYQYHMNGNAPDLPMITAGASASFSMAIATLSLFVLTVVFLK